MEELFHFDEELLLDGAEEGGVEFEDDEKRGAIDVVVKKRQKPPRFSKEELGSARLLHCAFLVCCVAHARRLAAMAEEWPQDEAAPEKVAAKTAKRLEAVLARHYKSWIKEAASDAECFARLSSFVSRCCDLECRICFAPHFVTWKPKKKAEKKTEKKRSKKKRRRSSGAKEDVENEDNEEEDDELEEEDEEGMEWSAYWLQVWLGEEWKTVVPDKKAQKRVDDSDAISYVFAARKKRVREIGSHYAAKWSRTVKQRRFDEDYLAATIAACCGAQSDAFDAQSDAWDEQKGREVTEAEEVPSSLSSLRGHPTFVLEKLIPKYSVLRQGAQPVGQFGDAEENVYLRRDLADVHTREQWLERHAMVPIEGVEAAKKVKGRKKGEAELFAPWQVERYDPGEAENGVVPKNDHGNVWLYNADTMMPRGCVLVKASKKTADLLGVDSAKAVVAWEFKRGHSYPIMGEGIVVAKEFADTVTLAQEERSEAIAEEERQKTHDTILKNWKRLIHRALTFKRLGKLYKK